MPPPDLRLPHAGRLRAARPAPRGRAAIHAAAAIGALLIVHAAGPATGQTTGQPTGHAEDPPPEPQRLEEIERTLKQEGGRIEELEAEAAALAAEVAQLRQELIAAARAAQDSEEEASAIEATLAALEAEEGAKAEELAARRSQLVAVIGALQRLALQPPEAMLLGPARPLGTVRGAMLLRVAIPAVEARAQALREEIDSLRSLRREIDGRRQELGAATARLEEERRTLAGLIERKQALQQSTASERAVLEQRVAMLGREAADLKELMARLANPPPPVPGVKPPVPGGTAPPSPPPGADTGPAASAQPAALLRLERPPEIRDFPAGPDAGIGLVVPARGTVAIGYGEITPAGQPSMGITIATRPAAQIVSPFDGQVMFRGPFRGYGQILILEHPGGYHTLLAGLGRTDAIAGQWLLAGEPVGVMADGDGRPELYLELRHDGQPIDPLPWLDIRDSKTE